MIFCDPAVSITTNLLLIFVFCMCRTSVEDKYYAIRLIKYSFKNRKKIKNTRGVHILFFIKVCPFLHTISYSMFMYN